MELPPPVGEACTHTKQFNPSPIQDPFFRLDDEGKWIYYHKYYETVRGLFICGKPEPWRWNKYLRYCGECNQLFSNPWVPICGDCWTGFYDDPNTFPSWSRVIGWDMRL